VTPATVSEVINMGWTVRHVLKFDDDVEVRITATHTHTTLLVAIFDQTAECVLCEQL